MKPPKLFKKDKPPYRLITVRVDTELHEELKKLNIHISDVTRESLNEAVRKAKQK